MIFWGISGVLVSLGLMTSVALAQPTAAIDCSGVEAHGERALCHEMVLPASSAELWRLWTTSDGLQSWLAPVVRIDARPGGFLETSYDARAEIGDAGNIRNRVVALVSERLLVIQIAAAPLNFPHADDARELVTLIELEPNAASETRVRVTMLGYREVEEFAELYDFFARGNAITLSALHKRVSEGPTDWAAQQQAGE